MLYPQSDTRPARIFISHADEDKEFAKAVVTLLTAIGIDTKNSILCTSESGLGIKVGKDWVDELKRCFTDYRTYVIIIHSSHLYLSPVSMNEMGAAWVKDCPVFSFLVNGFMEGSMAGVFTSNHQGVLVGRKDIAPDVDQLKEEVTELFGLKPIQEEDWVAVRGEFINTIISLPADRGIVRGQFDINLIERIHIQINPLLGGDEKNEEQNIKWADILKAVEGSLRRPHTEKAIVESLKNVFEGIVEDDCKAIIDKLYEYGLAETRTITTEYDGISVAWYFTEKGRDAYARSMNYHLQPINQAYDEHFQSLAEYKQEDNFNRILKKISLDDVRQAISRSERIEKNNESAGHTLYQYRGFKYFKENPSLSVWKIIKDILTDCGLN